MKRILIYSDCCIYDNDVEEKMLNALTEILRMRGPLYINIVFWSGLNKTSERAVLEFKSNHRRKKIDLTSDHFDSKSNYDIIINYIYEDLAPIYAYRLKKFKKTVDLTNENTKLKITASMNLLSMPEREIIIQRNNGVIRKDLLRDSAFLFILLNAWNGKHV